MNIPLRLIAVAFFTLVGFLFPPSLILAAIIAISIYTDTSAPATREPRRHGKLQKLTDQDSMWMDSFFEVCESPAETAFLNPSGPVFAKIKAPAIRSKVLILTIASGSQNVSHCLVKQGPVRPSAEAPHQTLLGRGH